MTADGVVIVGGGLAGQACAQTLRKNGYDGRVRMVCSEPRAPYDRPSLSKGYLAGTVDETGISLKSDRWHSEQGIELLLGRAAAELRPETEKLALSDGSVLGFDRLLIACGSAARKLPALSGFENVHSLRTLDDARRLRSELGNGSHIAVVGSGFIGQEVAASARTLGDDVTIIEALGSPLEGVLGAAVGRELGNLHTDRGSSLLTGAVVEGARGNGRVEELLMADGRRVACDTVVVGIGARPAASWLAGSGLNPDGVITDLSARTPIPGVFAAGDVASTFDHRTGTWTRSEHWDSAVHQGRNAALSMLGKTTLPPPPPSFWSDQYDHRIQYVGYAGIADRVEMDTNPERGKLRVRYLRGADPVAALAVDDPRMIAATRRELEKAFKSKTTTNGTR
ncbi:MAG: FAD-dependent oxidoreductase [Solirubrobacterales bacterium]|nr:FAD-dependent oxidoreductase [Solirubrobacterales bacterium]